MSQDSLVPIPSQKFAKYATEHGGKVEDSSSMRYEAYQSLLDHRIRNAWVSILANSMLSSSDTLPALHIVSRTPEFLSRGLPAVRLTSFFEPFS
jgi:metaxin